MIASKAFDPAGPYGFDVRPAWRRDDPEIAADAIGFWSRLGLLPKDVAPGQRAQELVAAAYKDGRLVAVSTAHIETIDFLGARMAVIRGATDPDYRRSHAQLALAAPSRRALEEWALANPDERCAGGIVFVDPAEWGDFARLPVISQKIVTFIDHAFCDGYASKSLIELESIATCRIQLYNASDLPNCIIDKALDFTRRLQELRYLIGRRY